MIVVGCLLLVASGLVCVEHCVLCVVCCVGGLLVVRCVSFVVC